eukprot:8704421-Lingulodinium_polyedra.AAC.1
MVVALTSFEQPMANFVWHPPKECTFPTDLDFRGCGAHVLAASPLLAQLDGGLDELEGLLRNPQDVDAGPFRGQYLHAALQDIALDTAEHGRRTLAEVEAVLRGLLHVGQVRSGDFLDWPLGSPSSTGTAAAVPAVSAGSARRQCWRLHLRSGVHVRM